MIKVAARGSKLSKAQADLVIDYLKRLGYDVSFIEVKTRGDINYSSEIGKIGKGIFEKEVNEMVLKGEADLAVHSMKDIETTLDEKLEVIATLPRGSPFDIVISRNNKSIYSADEGIVGSSSVRRQKFTHFINPNLQISSLRGNLDTRISKLFNGSYDFIIVAEAGIERLKLNVKYERLNPVDLTPAANQGIIAVVARKDNKEIKKVLENFNSEDSRIESIAEREVGNILGAGCNSPLGVFFRHIDNKLEGIATIYTNKSKFTATIVAGDDPKKAGDELARRLKEISKEEGNFL
ncbi:hydroxymethylbilane synthase [Sulfuracidifex metallicus]|uniref:hydroxymethylbilane synthase n=1 Tax=Sulfuracidifex metallicus TaxID=47303 RepID=UPI0009F8E841|nr:hydroxymethylbilane synthase [Sulfuracidifex metallicus]